MSWKNFAAAINPTVALGTALQGAGDLYGAHLNRRSNRAANHANREMQEEFARMGIRWRVADAKEAGLSPLAVIGSTGASAAPSYVGDDSMGSAVSNLGQNISRAVQSTMTGPERERAVLENELLRTQIEGQRISNVKSSQIGPPMPGTTEVHPAHITVPSRTMGEESGEVRDYQYSRTAKGGLSIVPSGDVKQLIEDTTIPEAMWSIRNHLRHIVKTPPYPNLQEHPLPPGFKYYVWSPARQEWVPSKKRSNLDRLYRRFKGRWPDERR